jgi:hypothetical protein
VIPEPQHLDVLRREKPIPFLIPCPLVRESVVPAIQLDCELGERAMEVEEVRAAGVLAAELELRKMPVTEQPP